MKRFFLGIFILILSGCSNSTSIISSNTNTKFVLGQDGYAVFLPTDWQSVSPNKNIKDTVFLAKKYSANISIVSGGESSERIKEKLLEDAKLYLPGFNLLSNSGNTFSFETYNGTEKRTYIQKLTFFDEKFLVSSCSYRNDSDSTDCNTILNSVSQE